MTNPVLAGCHPDPSVCRVGEDYYLVCSSFSYFPALPIFHSSDLLEWTPIAHVVTDARALAGVGVELSKSECSDGFWAPTIRHHEGVFYVVVATARERRGETTLLFTATDARGPWSAPVRLDADGIDPSLFFDDDGTCWFHAARDATVPGAGPGELYVRRLDLETLQLVGPETIMWHGAQAGAWVEAPHLYKREGRYVLLAAEGGTGALHSVTAATASHPAGPWRTDPRSPLLTHRHLGAQHPVQNVGHADLVDTPEGETWAVVLGIRPIDGVHTLGREVFLVPVQWSSDGPVLAPGAGQVLVPGAGLSARGGELIATASASAPVGAGRDGVVDRAVSGGTAVDGGAWGRTAWEEPVLTGSAFAALRGPVPGVRALTPDGAGAVLAATGTALDSPTGTPAFLGYKQRDVRFRAEMRFTFAPAAAGDVGGLAVFNTPEAFVCAVVGVDRSGTVYAELTGAALSGLLDSGECASPPRQLLPVGAHGRWIVLAVTGDVHAYSFSVALEPVPGSVQQGALRWHPIGRVARRALSTEAAGGFVGVHLGPYVSGSVPPAGIASWPRSADPVEGAGAVLRVRSFRYRSGAGEQARAVPGVIPPPGLAPASAPAPDREAASGAAAAVRGGAGEPAGAGAAP
ncbi:glycoside hydrolase family 43 protein [Kineococcus sp. TRM81007]|uniref:glycoside hydrolase family 43 protein n=1 Tax=Kineococcus sp. TRM81007 TaxID=2925831 RepID=UPI001F58DB22|nr:glycoside hydrolase family 43 protein [Kineococcus sp. TRM81007]MCI2237747.1 glycoside hydrolase family 43 protein [Kineococcus sp. TRM81007]